MTIFTQNSILELYKWYENRLFSIKNDTYSGTASNPSLRSSRDSSDALLQVDAKIMKLFPVNSFTTDTKYVS